MSIKLNFSECTSGSQINMELTEHAVRRFLERFKHLDGMKKKTWSENLDKAFFITAPERCDFFKSYKVENTYASVDPVFFVVIEHLDMVLVYEPFTMKFITTYKLNSSSWITACVLRSPEIKLNSFREWLYTGFSKVSKQVKTAN